MTINVLDVKRKILNYVTERGPSLPVHLTKVSEMNLTFTSAILSELLAEKKLKLSHLRVGASPLYYLPGQENKLESFVSNLKEPEIEAFNKLKQNKVLDDEQQSPVIRVALRSISDFAIPIKHNQKIYWKYHLMPDDKASLAISEGDEPVQAVGSDRVLGQQIWEDIQKQQVSKEKIEEMVQKRVQEITNKMNQDNLSRQNEKPQELVQEKPVETNSSENIQSEEKVVKKFESPLKDSQNPTPNQQEESTLEQSPPAEIKKEISKTTRKTKKRTLKEIFLEEATDKINSLDIEILEILKSDSNKLIAKVKQQQEFLLIYTKKKRMEEKEVLRDLKKYCSMNLNFKIYLEGEPSKKITEKIELLNKIQEIQKIPEQ